jgi:hypothetical protein
MKNKLLMSLSKIPMAFIFMNPRPVGDPEVLGDERMD